MRHNELHSPSSRRSRLKIVCFVGQSFSKQLYNVISHFVIFVDKQCESSESFQFLMPSSLNHSCTGKYFARWYEFLPPPSFPAISFTNISATPNTHPFSCHLKLLANRSSRKQGYYFQNEKSSDKYIFLKNKFGGDVMTS